MKQYIITEEEKQTIENINKGFFIEGPNIILLWKATKDEILALNLDFIKLSDNYYTLDISCPKLPFVNKLGLNFTNNTFKKLGLYCTTELHNKVYL